jgi:triphosphoribosyl-dephospho-CoA synthase
LVPYLVGLYAQLACIWEATARKAGNVHRFVDFEDVNFLDYIVSAAAMAPVLAEAESHSVGQTVFEAVRRTRGVVRTNTNLGILLLFAPLARAPAQPSLRTGLEQVLAELTVNDAALVYQAIRLANPGGLGQVPEQDVAAEPTQTLRQVMDLAAGHDLIARQYANGFREVFEEGTPALEHGLEEGKSLEGAIIACQLHLLERYPDSLIARKRGPAEAETAARLARRVLEHKWPHTQAGWTAFGELDTWLRAAGHSRNPGTTADLVTACLFVALRAGTIQLPLQYPWSAGFHHE